MHDFWKIPITEMMYTKLQNYEKYVGWQTCNTTFLKIVDVLLLFLLYCLIFLSSQVHITYVQIFLNVSF